MQKRMRHTGLLAALLVFGVGGAAAFVPMGGAVVATGQVDIGSRVKHVAHARGGVVAELKVHDGSHVRKGDVMVRLDDAVTGAESQISGQTVDQLMAQRARLEAESTGAARIDWPPALVGRTDASAFEAMRAEQLLFETHRSEQASMQAQLSARIAEYQAELDGQQSQVASTRQQIALVEPERDGIASLYEKGLVPLARRNQMERTVIELRGRVTGLQSSIAQARARIAEARAQLAQQMQTRRADAGAQLGAMASTVGEERIRNATASNEQERSLIRATATGVVNHLQATTVGDLVQPGAPILEIVPENEPFMVEAAVSPADIDRIHKGQAARIRFTGFNRATTPEIPGTVSFVPSDRTVDPERKASYYAVRIAIDQKALRDNPAIRLKQGMPAEILMSTGYRTMLTYILKPLSDQFARAMTD